MGGGISNQYYGSQREDLRASLIKSFVENPENHIILSNIARLKEVLTLRPDICATAVKESSTVFEPTSKASAKLEFERLIAVYEDHMKRKSVLYRIGISACPLGHRADKFDVVLSMCAICSSQCNVGYSCSYCEYCMCEPCAVIYCRDGHAMKLWTHAESQHHCAVCKSSPITSGYMCTVCHEYNICDACTHVPGRRAVQNDILERIAAIIDFMKTNAAESTTAERTISEYQSFLEGWKQLRTIDIHLTRIEYKRRKPLVKAEVILARLTAEICKIRHVIGQDSALSTPAKREAEKDGDYTVEEVARLKDWVAVREKFRAVEYRSQSPIACPLGHPAHYYQGCPATYIDKVGNFSNSTLPEQPPQQLREVIDIEVDEIYSGDAEAMAASKRSCPHPWCKICARVAPEGYHCSLCEYDLCMTCGVIYCCEGHAMTLWTITVPGAQNACVLCGDRDFLGGYRCFTCNVDFCDRCTRKEKRAEMRERWEKELQTILSYFRSVAALSDIANMYRWRSSNYIVSVALLVAEVNELRDAQAKVKKQVKYKAIIEEIKSLRSRLTLHPEISMLARKLCNEAPNFVYQTKKDANSDLKRLKDLWELSESAKQQHKRQACRCACPLGHAMVLVAGKEPSLDELITKFDSDSIRGSNTMTSLRDSTLRSVDSYNTQLGFGRSLPLKEIGHDFQSIASPFFLLEDGTMTFAAGDTNSFPNVERSVSSAGQGIAMRGEGSRAFTATAGHSQTSSAFVDSSLQHPDVVHLDGIACDLCALPAQGGRHCLLCLYSLCATCSIVFCRNSHPMTIWTLPGLEGLSCSICRTPNISSGYRCVTCDEEICDLCTNYESRESLVLWPKREIRKIMNYFESIKDRSKIAQAYWDRAERDSTRISHRSLSLMCSELNELRRAKVFATEEYEMKSHKLKCAKYGLEISDM